MKIQINDLRSIKELQGEFNACFPFLKIEFFDAPYQKEMALPKSKMFDSGRRIRDARKLQNEGLLEISPKMKVSELEFKFWNEFGLSAQIFRRSGNLWIETSLTDSWTLEQQNREGSELAHSTTPFQQAEENDITDRDKWE